MAFLHDLTWMVCRQGESDQQGDSGYRYGPVSVGTVRSLWIWMNVQARGNSYAVRQGRTTTNWRNGTMCCDRVLNRNAGWAGRGRSLGKLARGIISEMARSWNPFRTWWSIYSRGGVRAAGCYLRAESYARKYSTCLAFGEQMLLSVSDRRDGETEDRLDQNYDQQG